LFVIDYSSGKALYSAFASYHAYLEFPVLLAVVLGLRGAAIASADTHRASVVDESPVATHTGL
jgi:hypothetical protein